MCLNEKLRFNIKIKSRNCELFVLKKVIFEDFQLTLKNLLKNFYINH